MLKKIAICLSFLTALVFTTLLSAPAQAQVDTDSDTKFTVLLDPMLLFWPLGQLTAELKVHPLLGVAVIGGYGQITVDRNSGLGGSQTIALAMLRLGGQVNAYLWGNFASGSHFGVEVMHQLVGASDDGITKSRNNTQLGIYGGYKYTHMLSPTVGLTGLLQAGYSFEVQTTNTSTFVPPNTVYRFGLPSDALLNLKLGATF